MRVGEITPDWCDEHLDGWEYNTHTQTGKAWCPCHDDEGSSMKGLSVSFANGIPLLKCHSVHCGATGTEVLAARNGHVEVEPTVNKTKRAKKIEATYDYGDFQVVRYEPKGFAQRRRVNGKWVWNLDGVELCLYHEDEVREAAARSDMVYVVEGEKDVDRLRDEGFVATCNPMGAGKWRDEFAEVLRGVDVLVVADRDNAGALHARQVRRSLIGVARSVRVCGALTGKDVSDHLDAGHTLEELQEIDVDDRAHQSGRRLQTRSFSEIESKETLWLVQQRIPQGAITLLAGMPGIGKTLWTCDLAAVVSRGDLGANQTVLFATAEDSAEHTLKPRLTAANADLANVHHLYATILDEDGGEIAAGSFALPSDVASLSAAVEEHRPALLIVDPLMAHLDPTINSWKDESARQAMTPLTTIAEEYGCAVICAMHLNKRRDADPLVRLGGSLGGIAGPARAIFFFGEAGDERLLVHTKHNLSPKQPTLVYTIDTVSVRLDDGTTSEVGKVVLAGETDRGIEAILEPDGTHTPIEDAISFLEETLRDGAVPAKQVQGDAKDEGISASTLQRAKEKLGVMSHRQGFGGEGKWVWELPPTITVTFKGGQADGGDA
jgi:hypothetical protein